MDSGSPALPSLPIRAGHTFTNVTGQGNSRLHLGDNHYKIGMRVVVGRIKMIPSDIDLPDVHSTEQPEFTGHYSSTALRKVASYVPRPALHTQVKERLHDTLEERGYSCKILVVCGLGGAGKSQLMLNYVEVFKDDYTAVFWIDAGSKDRLEADYRRIHNLLLHPGREDVDISTCVSEIRQWCQRKSAKYLFVLDSADSIEDADSNGYIDLQNYLVDAASADVVITTRVQSAKDMKQLEAVQVAELTPDEARDIFTRRMNLQSPDVETQREIDAVTAELGHFALAVSLAAAYVASTRRLRAHPINYLVEYAERKKTLLARKPKKHIDQYGESVLTTWETTYAAVSSRCPGACNLLALIAFLSSSDLVPELFSSNYYTASSILASVVFDQESTSSLQKRVDDGMETLELYSLLQWNSRNAAFSMHKLVHAWSMERLEPTERVTFCLAAWHYLRHLCSVASEIPAMSGRLASHITACFSRVRTLCAVEDSVAASFAESARYLVDHLEATGQIDCAYELHSFAHKHYQKRRSVDPIAYARSLGERSQILMRQCKYDTAQALLHQAINEVEPLSAAGLEIKEFCQHLLAMILAQHHKKLGNAEQMLQDILLNCSDGEDSSRADIKFNLAHVLMKQNRNGEAEAIFAQLLNECDDPFGLAHAEISGGLGRALRKQGKFGEAEVVARRASDVVPIHGPADIRSQCALLALGKVKLAQREYGEAASILRQACDAIATPYHTDHLRCQVSMGKALKHLKCYDESITFYARALDGSTQMTGTDHELSQQCSKKLDKLRALVAKSKRTETVEQREREKDHGADHPEESSDGRTGSEEGSK